MTELHAMYSENWYDLDGRHIPVDSIVLKRKKRKRKKKSDSTELQTARLALVLALLDIILKLIELTERLLKR